MLIIIRNPARQLTNKPTQRFPAQIADRFIDRKPPSFPVSPFTISFTETRDCHHEDAHMVFLISSPVAEFTNEVWAKPSVRASLFQALQTRRLTKVVSVVRNPALGDTPAAIREFSNEEHLEGRIPLERDHSDLLHRHH
jgi:hypothetical protein